MGGIVDSVFGGPPDAPDPYATAAAQGQANIEALYESAKINQMGQQGPGYNISYTGEIGDPNRTMHYSLDPYREALAQQMGRSSLNQAGMIGGPIDYSGVAPIPTGNEAWTNDIINQQYDAMMSRVRPDLERNYESTMTDLAARGIPIGQEASNDVMESLARQEQDQIMAANAAATQLGLQAAGQQFGQEMGAHQQGMSNIGFDRNQAMNELAMMINANPYNQAQIQNPTQYQMAPPDISGLVQGNYNAEMGAYGANMGALGQIGGMAGMGLMMSDVRLKHNINRIDELPSGIGVYEFSYKGEDTRHIGVMAQEVEPIIPDAVSELHGVKFVNYAMLR